MYVAFIFHKLLTVALYLFFFIIKASKSQTSQESRLDLFGDVMHLVLVTNVGQESVMLVYQHDLKHNLKYTCL